MYQYIWYVEVADDHLFATYWYVPGTIYKYAFIFPYLAPGSFIIVVIVIVVVVIVVIAVVVVVLLLLLCAIIYLALKSFYTCCCLHYTSSWYQGTSYQVYITLRAVVSTKKSKKIAPKRVETYQYLVPGQPPPKKVLVCCAFGLRTWDFVVLVVRIYLFGVDEFLCLMLLFILYE